MKPALDDALTRARLVREGCGDREVGDDLASVSYAAAAVVELASALELDEADIRGAAAAVAEACALRFQPPGSSSSVRQRVTRAF